MRAAISRTLIPIFISSKVYEKLQYRHCRFLLWFAALVIKQPLEVPLGASCQDLEVITSFQNRNRPAAAGIARPLEYLLGKPVIVLLC